MGNASLHTSWTIITVVAVRSHLLHVVNYRSISLHNSYPEPMTCADRPHVNIEIDAAPVEVNALCKLHLTDDQDPKVINKHKRRQQGLHRNFTAIGIQPCFFPSV